MSRVKIETKIKNDYLKLRLTGNFSLLEAKRVFKYSVDTALEHNKSKIIIDILEIEGIISTTERFEMSEFLAKYLLQNAFGKVQKIAFVGKEPIIDKNRFGETVAINRGVNEKVFTDLSDAIKWLNE